jgi:3-oxoadipate enol-lactonase
MKIQANGITMNYEASGQGNPLVLIHGAGDNLNMWYHQLPAFSQKYRVISYDFRGAGGTEVPEGDYTIAVMAEDAYQLMQALGVGRGYLLGFSMGGRIALEVAINHPEMVKALVLANSALGLTPPSPESREWRRRMVASLEHGEAPSVMDMLTVSSFSPDYKSRHPAEFDRYLKVKLHNHPEGFARLMRSMGLLAAPPYLSRLKCPVLIIAGEKDILMGTAQGRLAHEAIAGSKLVAMPSGHATPVEAPQAFNSAVLEFLAGVDAA